MAVRLGLGRHAGQRPPLIEGAELTDSTQSGYSPDHCLVIS